MTGNITLEALDEQNLSLKDMHSRDRHAVLFLLKVFTVKMTLTKSESTLEGKIGLNSYKPEIIHNARTKGR